MDVIMSIIDFDSPGEIQQQLALSFKQARLNLAHSRTKAAKLSGVPAATIKSFETNGQISLRQFVMLSHVYGDMSAFKHLFPEQEPQTLDQLLTLNNKPKRQRGRS